MRRSIFILFAAGSLAFASEPSAFGAGDLSSKNPYGLTQTEKYILENKEYIDSLKDRIVYLETSLEELSSGLDAFRSLAAGKNEKLFNLAKKLHSIESNVALNSEYHKKLDTDISSVGTRLSSFEQNQSLINNETRQMDENLKTAVKELSALIDKINADYVTKNEMKSALRKLVGEIQSNAPEVPVSPKEHFAGKKAADILAESKELYKKKRFSKALPGLEYLGKNSDYEKAEVMYLLGEIYYQTTKYNKAIIAFKESVRLDDKAKYLPVLLFHTGIAYAKMGKKSEAKKFYESLISLYPDSYLVDSAKKRLRKL